MKSLAAPRPMLEAPRRVTDSSPSRLMSVVVVPDFRGNHAHVQEAQALFLLASWLEQQGSAASPSSHRVSLQLACIGQPPKTVRRLAERAGAEVSLHDPVAIHPRHHVGNKLRGLEVAGDSDAVLLLDVDCLLLQNIRWLAAWSDSLAAAADDTPKLNRDQWDRIHAGLDFPRSTPPATYLTQELDLPGTPYQLTSCRVRLEDSAWGPPYFNSGVLLVPRGCELRQLWQANIHRLREIFPEGSEGDLKWIHRSDQAGLAISMEMLRGEGWAFRQFPLGVNARWRNLYAGAPSLDEIQVLHLTTFLHDLAPGPLTAERLLDGARRYLHQKLRRRFARMMLAESWHGRPLTGWRHYRQGRAACVQLDAYLERLVERHVRPIVS